MRVCCLLWLAGISITAAFRHLAEVAHYKQDLDQAGSNQQHSDQVLLDLFSGSVSRVGLRDLSPDRSGEHIRTRLAERDEDVDIDASVLTPKAHKRFVQERGLVGGILAPLTGILAAVDIPTPLLNTGLKAIPGNDPAHQYVPPGPTDIRGVCPTLNTLANHGYISRTGITSFAESTNAIQLAYSLSFGTSVFVAALGLLAGGDIPTGIFSIGGRDSRVPSTLGPVLGIDRHGLFEIDASMSRGDRYFGDNHSFNITRWNKLVRDANRYGNGLFNFDALKRNTVDSIQESRDTNPQFTLGPNFGALYATRALLARPLPNGTTPNIPDYKNIASFYLNETFPQNWYRIPTPYTIPQLLSDIGDIFLFQPQPLGRNYEGRFIPLNITIPTAPADIGCLAASLLVSVAPNQVVEPVVEAANALKDQIFEKVLGASGCDISIYARDGGSAAYEVPGEDTDGGSGSGITGLGEWDAQSVRPEGRSKGE